MAIKYNCAGMRQGVYDSDLFCLFLTSRTLSRPFCLKEITWALEFGKPIVVIVELDRRLCAWDADLWRNNECFSRDEITDEATRETTVTEWTKGTLQKSYPAVADLIDDHLIKGTMIPYRRREFEADAMARELVRRAGQRTDDCTSTLSWGSVMPPSRFELTARRNSVRCSVRLIANVADGHAAKLVKEMQERLTQRDPKVTFETSTVDGALLVVLSESLLQQSSLMVDLYHALERVERERVGLVFVYLDDWGFNLLEMYKVRPALKAALREHEALAHRSNGYEQNALANELLRRLHRRPKFGSRKQFYESEQPKRHTTSPGKPV